MPRSQLLATVGLALSILGVLGAGPGTAAAAGPEPLRAGAWKGTTTQGFPVWFRVTGERTVTNIRFTYRESICGKQSPHDPTTVLGIDGADRFGGAIYSGRLEFEGSFLAPTTVKGRLIALESTGLPGCLRKVVGFTAHPRSRAR